MSQPLKARLQSGQFLIVPGVQDMLAAKMIDHVGFDYVYGSGFWMTGSALGLPDAGIASYTQMVDRMGTLVRSTRAKVIADADTGYGGLLNVHHTVRGYEQAGVIGVQIEDQEFPKKCGHTPGKRLISAEDMARKIAVACDARTSADTLIIARTDARAGEGLDEALRRAEIYEKAGADVLFVEALHSEEEMAKACAAVSAPMIANMANGGYTPAVPASRLAEIGYACAIYPSMTSLVALEAMRQALFRLKHEGLGESPEQPLFDFKTICELLGFDEVWAFDRKWAD
jgi:2-methylisocitrate lyase-like PEP mutase family enzyme